MNQEELDICLSMIESYLQNHTKYTAYRNSTNLAKIVSAGIIDYTGGGTISNMIKVYTENGECLFTFQYENYDRKEGTLYGVRFLYDEFTEIINPDLKVFKFIFNEFF